MVGISIHDIDSGEDSSPTALLPFPHPPHSFALRAFTFFFPTGILSF